MRYESMFKEQFSLAYVRAVVALAGCDVTVYNVDVNGCDIGIHATDDNLHPRLPKVDVQMKCTAREVMDDNALIFDLDVPTYRKLRLDVTVPRILVVVLVPRDPVNWILQTEEEMVVRHCAYWRSLYDLTDTRNEEAQRVRLPRTQIFNVEALQGILAKVNRGEKP